MPRAPIQSHTDSGEDPWKTVSNGISDILACKQSNLSFVKLNNAVSNLISSSTRSNELKNGLEQHLKAHFKMWKEQLSQKAGNMLIFHFSKIFDDFKNYCLVIPKIYMLYDSSQREKDATLNIIRRHFRDVILSDEKLIEETTESIERDIASARSHVEVDLKKIFNLLDMYYSFKDDPICKIFGNFYGDFINETKKYYDDFFRTKFEGCTFYDYLQQASAQFEHEEFLLATILDKKPNEIEYTLKIVLEMLLSSHEDKFLQGPEPPISVSLTAQDSRPMKWLVDTYLKFDVDLKNVYTSCARYINDEMVKQSANFTDDMKASQITHGIKVLMDLTNNMSNSYKIIFGDVKEALEAVEKEIIKGWNHPNFKISENFVVYIDSHIKSEFKNLTPEEKENFPSEVAKFYRRIEDKVSFKSNYESYMALRFIKMKDKVYDYELKVVTAIRDAKSQDFAKYLGEYKKKIQDSADIAERFTTECGASFPKVKFEPILLDSNTYHLDTSEAKYLPPPIDNIHKQFVNFYTKMHEHRRLVLLQSVSSVESKLVIPKNQKANRTITYIISSDIICASILNEVSTAPKKFKELTVITKDRTLAAKYLVRLCAASCPILKRTSATNDRKICDDDLFQINPQFFCKNVRVAVAPVVNERKKNKELIDGHIEKGKKEVIKAAAVRTMKQKNKLEQTDLENEIVQALAQYFRPEQKTLRDCIIELENDEYFKRKQIDGGRVMIEYIQ
ncbi:ubiquitin-protein ligase (Cullin) [Histomonas meleagridis]|uniref:ubiquitin-protein ligase (Cullin) n=1 Tax=Histomonas meleagridis TaxID=135588 RepID=UPI003559A6DE|nr:ubiquitin-protein ligase (Cullin) [Histomonas meleagridis]KAH0796761.1 ubiquitin-protein ligase (Cullin) [Histomonas meleagridis]